MASKIFKSVLALLGAGVFAAYSVGISNYSYNRGVEKGKSEISELAGEPANKEDLIQNLKEEGLLISPLSSFRYHGRVLPVEWDSVEGKADVFESIYDPTLRIISLDDMFQVRRGDTIISSANTDGFLIETPRKIYSIKDGVLTMERRGSR